MPQFAPVKVEEIVRSGSNANKEHNHNNNLNKTKQKKTCVKLGEENLEKCVSETIFQTHRHDYMRKNIMAINYDKLVPWQHFIFVQWSVKSPHLGSFQLQHERFNVVIMGCKSLLNKIWCHGSTSTTGATIHSPVRLAESSKSCNHRHIRNILPLLTPSSTFLGRTETNNRNLLEY